MGWNNTRPPSDPKYTSPRHLAYTRHLKGQLAARGTLTCTAAECLFPTRAIANPNGNAPDGLTAGHAPNGITYDGPQHRACNTRDGSVRARARQQATRLRW